MPFTFQKAAPHRTGTPSDLPLRFLLPQDESRGPSVLEGPSVRVCSSPTKLDGAGGAQNLACAHL